MIRTPRHIPIALLLGLALARPAVADPGVPAPVVESAGPNGYRVRIATGEPTVIRGDVLGHALAEILLPGAEPSVSVPGAAPLPARTVLLRAPWGVRASVTSVPGAARSLGTLRLAPIPRLLTDARARARVLAAPDALERAMRGAAPSMRSQFGSAAPLHTVTETAAAGERILAVTVRPASWDPWTGEARVVEEIVLEVRWDRAVEPLAEPEARAGGVPRGARARGSASLAPSTTVGPQYAPRASLATAWPQRVDTSRPWVALGATRPGLYQLGASDLAGAGIATGSIDPASIRIFRATPGEIPESVDVDLGPDSLRECAIEVTGALDGTLDPADRVYFYATGATGFGHDLARGKGPEYEEPDHSGVETLWLTWGPGPWIDPPRRMATRDAAPVTPGAPVLSFVAHRVHYETNRIADFNKFQPGQPFRWERWFDRLLTQGSRITFELRPPGAEPGTAADVRVRMWGVGASPGAGVPDHVVRIYWNRALVDTAGWELNEPQDLAASGLGMRALDSLDIEVPVLVDPGPNPNRLDQSYLAWFELGYQRRLAAENDTLQFAAPDSVAPGRVRYAITSVSDSAAAWLLDRTDPESPVRLVNGAWSGAAPALAVTVEDEVGGERRRYSLVSTARATRPASIALFAPPSSPRTVADLADTTIGADYIIVVPPAFLAQAETLAVYRSAFLSGVPSPRVRIATTDRIFAQFGSGRPSPVAIRNFVQYAYRHWTGPAVSYLCLLGDATYDPKNYLRFNVPDLVPTYSRYYDLTTRTQFGSDDFYGFLEGPGDVLLDLVVGRLPAGSAAQAATLVSGKLQAYEANREFDMWRARTILAADDANVRDRPDGLGNSHVRQMERKDRDNLPSPLQREKIYLNDFAFADTTRQSKPAAREEFIAQVNRGAWLTDYIGHGSENVLADEQLFRSIDAARLVNAGRPTIFGTFSCTVGKFDDPSSDGLGEQLLELPQGGSVASIAATDEAFGGPSTALNDDFVKYQFPLAPRVDSLRTSGLALALGKNENANPLAVELSTRKYVFLGDPGLVPPVPRGRGVWEKGPLDSIVRGDIVLLRGHALAAGDTLPDTLSTGVADVLIQGPPIRRRQTASTGEVVDYFVPGYTLFRGPVPLERGSFEVRFVVPTDARIVGAGGRLRALLSEAGGLGVGLAVDSIRIASAAPTRVDVEPPTIRLRYPSASDSTLRPGDRLTIEIADSSGIDLTRIDNAHSIFILIDDRGTPHEITGQFAYESGSYTRGSVEFVIPDLADGPHRFEIHASDTFRNIAVQNFIVDVARSSSAGSALVLDQVFNYPNPFPQETYLHARLNQPARLRIKILTVAGRRVREIDLDGKAGQNYIPWDGRDSVGEKVAIGVYLFHVTAESPSGGRVTAVGRALRTD